MRVFQRMIMTILLAVSSIFLLNLTLVEQSKKQQLCLEQLYLERFQQQLKRNGGFCCREYMEKYMELSVVLGIKELQITEYKREYDSSGKVYYSLITWTEIKDILLREEYYQFAGKSIIEISAFNKEGLKYLLKERIGEEG